MKMKSIRDYNRTININDSTLNILVSSIDAELFDDSFKIDCKITVGDLLLLRFINQAYEDLHDLLISFGYKSN